MDCIFCKIANGEIPSATLYEDEEVRVIFDINPASVGHVLILPKTHAASLLEYPTEKLGSIFALAQKIGNAMIKGLPCDGVNVLANCREAAGQTVDHFHVHIIPRYANDSTKDAMTIESGTIEKPDFDALKEAITKAF
ncbi:MAG: HIT family protein [Erysipelotrichaceae bacterium]|nr:HIT family protein [Erysipelotrichaceae bacterium]